MLDPMRVLVTGAGRSIGRATAEVFTERGHEVVATARDVTLLADLKVDAVLTPRCAQPRCVGRSAAVRGRRSTPWSTTPGVTGLGPWRTSPRRLRPGTRRQHARPLRLAQAVVAQLAGTGEWRAGQHQLGTGPHRHPARRGLCGIEARARGAVRDAPLRARALRDPGGHH